LHTRRKRKKGERISGGTLGVRGRCILKAKYKYYYFNTFLANQAELRTFSAREWVLNLRSA
jgi:hypothetical protein